jgi:hypothetical protein
MNKIKECKICMPNVRCVAEEKGRTVIDFLLDETSSTKQSISDCPTFIKFNKKEKK